ncbi:MAG: hypothetical protein HW397_391 [Dehalococcoidia bacterium]|nr:hypothetical protein [Dehalococcoidia bacterium]
MKDQFFADRNDYFKYDLMISLSEGLSGIHRFTFVPMLTPNDSTNHGNQKQYPPGNRRADLYSFLQECLRTSSRDITKLREFFGSHSYPFVYCPYADDIFFTVAERMRYFAGIPGILLENAVIFLDPDTGLQVKHMGRERAEYVLYDDVKGIYARMGDSSILAIYEDVSYGQQEHKLVQMPKHLQSTLGCPCPCAIGEDNKIAFITIAKSPHRSAEVSALLRSYKQQHPTLLIWDQEAG